MLFDSNAAHNTNVRNARWELAAHLTSLGASVRIAEMPELAGVNGPDDLIMREGDAAIVELLESAMPFADSAICHAQAAVRQLSPDSSIEEKHQLFTLLAQVNDEDTRILLMEESVGRLEKSCSRRTLTDAVRYERAEMTKKAELAKLHSREAALKAMSFPVNYVHVVESFFAERAYLPNGVGLVLALFAINTWCFEHFDTTPYLSVESATKGCGKTTILELLEQVCRAPQRVTSLTEAALFRVIEAEKPTLLVDEAETLMMRTERAEAIRGVANSGYKRGGSVLRASGQDHQLEKFDVYCPKAFAAIGGLDGPLLDRCIQLLLEKAPRGYAMVTSRNRILKRDAAPLREMLEAYSLKAKDRLIAEYEAEPDEGYWPQLHGRNAELWTPLLLHARLAGKEVEDRALGLALEFTGMKERAQADEEQLSLALDLYNVLDSLESPTFTPGEVVNQLTGCDSWGATFSRSGGGSPQAHAVKVGKFLKAFGLTSNRSGKRGCVYVTDDVLRKIKSHLPENLFAEVALVS